jgi:dipeptidyl aminopeptidase/acylaminoacyl peptidase
MVRYLKARILAVVLTGLSLTTIAEPATTQTAGVPAKKPLTHETLWMMKRVGAPIPSPDGKWVLFNLVEPAYDPDKAVSDLWLMPADGATPPRRLTQTKAAEAGAVWSPDSTRIAFSTKREDDTVPQIYILDVAGGGDAERFTSLSTGAANPQWRPDGKAILFESSVYPNTSDDEGNKKAEAERKARKYNVRTYEHFPVRFWNEWLDEKQPTILVQSLAAGSTAKDILSGTALAKTPGFSGSLGQEGDTRVSLSPIWSPDGQEIVFSATTDRWQAAYSFVRHHLYRMAATGTSEPREVVAQSGDYDSAAFSPDGRKLFFLWEPQNEEVYNLPRLESTEWPAAGSATLVARDLDRAVEKFAITPDGHTVYALVGDGANEGLYEVPASGGKPRPVIQPAVGGYTNLNIPAKAPATDLIATYGSSVSPAEIVRIDVQKATHTNLTNIDTAVAATIDWQAPQHFTFKSTKGRMIHNMIVLPAAFDATKKYPLVTLIHGGAASNNPDQIGLRWNYHLLAAPGYVILLTDYTGSTGFGEQFARNIKGDPLKTPGEEINQAVDEAIKRYPFIDGTRLAAAGASYGGHLANWMEATTTRFRCIVSHAGEVDLTSQWGMSDFIYAREQTNGGPPWEGNPIWREQSPITYAAKFKTPILLSIGERDFRVPIGNTLENWSALQRMKVPSKLLVWPDAWHWILKPEDSRHFYDEVAAWLAKYLRPDAPIATSQRNTVSGAD